MTKEEQLKETENIIFNAFPVGNKLNYLGAEMVVLAHDRGPTSTLITVTGKEPAVLAEYADKNGVIHQHAFKGPGFYFLRTLV